MLKLTLILLGILYFVGLVVVIALAVTLNRRRKLDNANKGILIPLFILSPILLTIAFILFIKSFTKWCKLGKQRPGNIWEVLK